MKEYQHIRTGIFKQMAFAMMVLQMIPFAYALYSHSVNKEKTIAYAQQTLMIESQKIATEIDLWMKKKLAVSLALSETEQMKSLAIDKIKPILQTLVKDPLIKSARVDNHQGDALVRSDNKSLKNYANRQYVRQVLEGQAVGQQVVMGRTGKKPTFCFSVPITSGDVIHGILHQCSFLDTISKKVTSLLIGKKGFAFLADADNFFIADGSNTLKLDQEVVSAKDHPAIARTHTNDIFHYIHNGIHYTATQLTAGLGWRLVVQQPTSEIMKPIEVQEKNGYILLALSAILSVIGAIGLSKLISAPVIKAHYQLEQMLRTDTLTGLPNRHYYLEKIEEMIQYANKNNSQFAYLDVDLTKFKDINDNYGHLAGDEVLRTISHRIQRKIKKTDTIARIGGDEFITILCDIEQENLAKFIERIISVCDDPVLYAKETIQVGMDIGASIYPIHGNTTKELYTKADQALYQAKASEDISYVIYEI